MSSEAPGYLLQMSQHPHLTNARPRGSGPLTFLMAFVVVMVVVVFVLIAS